jgi:hypothetical protein
LDPHRGAKPEGFIDWQAPDDVWRGIADHETALAFAIFGVDSAGPQPGVAASGVVDAASFRATVSAGSWFSIFGTNVSPVMLTWQASDFIGNALPIALDGVGVPSPFSCGGTSYVAATFADGTLVGKSGLLGRGMNMLPAKPGDLISFWGTGFGPTTINSPLRPAMRLPPSSSRSFREPRPVSIQCNRTGSAGWRSADYGTNQLTFDPTAGVFDCSALRPAVG